MTQDEIVAYLTAHRDILTVISGETPESRARFSE